MAVDNKQRAIDICLGPSAATVTMPISFPATSTIKQIPLLQHLEKMFNSTMYFSYTQCKH